MRHRSSRDSLRPSPAKIRSDWPEVLEGSRQLEIQLERVRYTRQDERAERVIDLLGRQVLVLLTHPPIHEADERPDQEADDCLELEWVEPARGLHSCQL